jgi:Glycosyl transferase family 2
VTPPPPTPPEREPIGDASRAHGAIQLTVIVPCYNGAATLERCLSGLLASTLPRRAWELIVVDDRSTDTTPDVARGMADVLLTTPPGPRGPALARNFAAEHARAEVLAFVDADVVVAPDALTRFATTFAAQPDVTAVVGAYDTSPVDPGLVSQYRNLLHHRVHALHAGTAQTFWAGLGAVRLAAFSAVGGFDGLRYPRPQIEDIELGYRLTDAGYRIVLDPAVQGTHLKHWTLASMLRTDLLDRAVPWMHLLLDRREATAHGPLNVGMREKVLTGVMGMALLTLGAWLITSAPALLLSTCACVVAVVIGNLPLFAWFGTIRGVRFALATVPLRLLFHLSSVLGASWSIVTHRFQVRRPARAPLRRATDRTVPTAQ